MISFVVSSGTGGSGGSGGSGSSGISIDCELPSDRDRVHLVVTLDGIPVYDKTVNTSQEFVRVNLSGSGMGSVVIYWDGLVYKEYTVQLD